MALPHTSSAYTLINMAKKFQDFFYGSSQDVTFEYMDENGNIHTTSVPNVAKVKANLEASAVTDSELANTLQNYYSKVNVDAIRDSILSNFNSYYNKTEVNNKINALTTVINDNKEILEAEIVEADKTMVMGRADFEAMAEIRRQHYAGSGFIDWGQHWLSPVNQGISTWGNNWNINMFAMGDNRYHSNQTGGLLPIVNVNGVRHKLIYTSLSGSSYNLIKLPEASRNNSVPVILDSTNAPAMKQGDMAVLADLDRELITNGTFDTDDISFIFLNRTSKELVDGGLKIKQINDNYDYSQVYYKFEESRNILSNEEIEVIVSIGDVHGEHTIFSMYIYNNGVRISEELKIEPNTSGTIRFKTKSTSDLMVVFQLNSSVTDDYVIIKSISIKQVSETPIVALQDTEAGDIYDQADKFETRDSISRQDLVFLELTTRYAA